MAKAAQLQWWKCPDGSYIEPLDALMLLFPHENSSDSRGNCFTPKHYKVPFLNDLLPERTDLYLPDDLIDILNVIFRMCVLLTIAFIVCKYIWEGLDPKFRAIQPSHKKWYVVANMFKAMILAALTLRRFFWKELYQRSILDDFSPLTVKRSSAIYIASDIVALYMVPKLPRTTIIHHIVTTLSCLVISSTNLEIKGYTGLLGFVKMGVLYGSLSALSFSVNAYLGLRVVYRDAKWIKILCYLSLFVYLGISFINWSFHVWWFVGVVRAWDYSIYSIVYIAVFYLIVSDDIVLIKWLLRQSSPMAGDEWKKTK